MIYYRVLQLVVRVISSDGLKLTRTRGDTETRRILKPAKLMTQTTRDLDRTKPKLTSRRVRYLTSKYEIRNTKCIITSLRTITRNH
jgi:vacuolar-type H+-ATPase subunit C/Vma6